MGTILRARWICSCVTLDNATRRILPSSRSSARVSTEASKDTTECAVDKRRCDPGAVSGGCPRPLREGVSELHRESTDLDQDDSSLPWSQSPDRAGKETTPRQSVPHLCSGHKNRQCR